MGDAAVRSLAKKTSGAISMSDLHGKSSEVVFTNTVNRTQANIHTLMGSPTVANIYIFENTATISSPSAGGWALRTGSFPAGSTLKIVNKGYIRGGGGNGGDGGNGGNNSNGQAGGTALYIDFPVSVDNTSGGIYGGGGGGAGMVAGAGEGSAFGGKGGGLGEAGSRGAGATGNGGRGGYSVETNGNAVTWIAEGDRKGSVA